MKPLQAATRLTRLTLLLTSMALALLTACSSKTKPAAATPDCPPCPVCPGDRPTEAQHPPVAPLQASSWEKLPGWTHDNLTEAWPALQASCRSLIKQARWQYACTQATQMAATPSTSEIAYFFEHYFIPWQVTNADGSTEGLVTGYYEPLIQGSRTYSAQYPWPVYGVPQDMLTIDLGSIYPDLKSKRLRGRLVDGNKVVPYWNRAEIDHMTGTVPAPVLFWAQDPIELFFLQIQGSGQISLPDGSRVRIGYADQNGYPYQSIGRWLIDQGELESHQASMQGIKQWVLDHPARLNELLNKNPSYVFFRELPVSSSGPQGAMGIPLTAERSIAIDPNTIPLGAPVFLSTTYPLSTQPYERLMMAQDTGGAIKGAVRADLFWGFGQTAGTHAGQMRQQGQMWVLLPKE